MSKNLVVIFEVNKFKLSIPIGSVKEITLKYFEKGHTFMACDSFHHSCEEGMRTTKQVYDFHDFTSIVDAKGSCSILQDFLDIPNGMGQGNRTSENPKLRNVKIVQFRHGCLQMFWKESYTQE